MKKKTRPLRGFDQVRCLGIGAQVHVRLPQEDYDALAELAAASQRSVGAEVRMAITAWLKEKA